MRVVRSEEGAFETADGGLASARPALADHETDTGRAVDWRIASLAAGVTRPARTPACAAFPAPRIRTRRSAETTVWTTRRRTPAAMVPRNRSREPSCWALD